MLAMSLALQLLTIMLLASGCMVVHIKFYGEDDLLKQSNAIARNQPLRKVEAIEDCYEQKMIGKYIAV
jgi:hypothetical protein